MTRRLDPNAIAALARLVAARAGDRQLALFAPIGPSGADWSRAAVVDASGNASELATPAANDCPPVVAEQLALFAEKERDNVS